jgi:hypothetical protein
MGTRYSLIHYTPSDQGVSMQNLGKFAFLTGHASCAVLYMQSLHCHLCCPLQPTYDGNITTALRRNRQSLVRRGVTTQIIVHILGMNDKTSNVPWIQKGTGRLGSTYSGPLHPITRLPRSQVFHIFTAHRLLCVLGTCAHDDHVMRLFVCQLSWITTITQHSSMKCILNSFWQVK